MSGAPILAATGLAKAFRPSRGLGRAAPVTRALDGVSVSLHPGEIVGLIGESGSGKTTVAKILTGLLEADDGTLTIEGRTIFAPGRRSVPAAQRRLQMVFQDPQGSLDPRMCVRDLVGEGLMIQGAMPREAIRAAVQRTLGLVGLGAETLERHAHEFSGGQRQRLCVARAVAMEPKVLIADEVVSALDVSVQLQILNLLLDLREQLHIAILFISHDIGVVEYLCDRVLVMYRGKIVEEGSVAEIIDRPTHPYTKLLLDARPRLTR
jgi:ABC-type glutathione transport system ATPase component